MAKPEPKKRKKHIRLKRFKIFGFAVDGRCACPFFIVWTKRKWRVLTRSHMMFCFCVWETLSLVQIRLSKYMDWIYQWSLEPGRQGIRSGKQEKQHRNSQNSAVIWESGFDLKFQGRSMHSCVGLHIFKWDWLWGSNSFTVGIITLEDTEPQKLPLFYETNYHSNSFNSIQFTCAWLEALNLYLHCGNFLPFHPNSAHLSSLYAETIFLKLNSWTCSLAQKNFIASKYVDIIHFKSKGFKMHLYD